MKTLLAVVVLFASSALAQLENTCGPGKACTVKTLKVTGGSGANNVGIQLGTSSNSLTSQCLANNNGTFPAYLILRGGLNLNVYACSTATCTSCGTNVWSWDGTAQASYSFWNLVGTIGIATGASGTGTAFASLPACSGTTGRAYFDSTSGYWRNCRSSGQHAIGNVITLGDTVSAYHPQVAVNLPVNQFTFPSQLFVPGTTSTFQTFSVRLDNAVTIVAGTGAGNAVYTVYNVTDTAATSATVTVPCASAAGTVTAGSNDTSLTIFGSQKTFQLRLTTNGCTTLPIVNLTASWSGNPIGS